MRVSTFPPVNAQCGSGLLIYPLIALLLMVQASCGFRVSGSRSLPFDMMTIQQRQDSDQALKIGRYIEERSNARVINMDVLPKRAGDLPSLVHLYILRDYKRKVILSRNASGETRQIRLERILIFRLNDAKQQPLITTSQIKLHRTISFSNEEVLAKQAEEDLLWRTIEKDLYDQLLRRLSKVRLPTGP